jgi:hypothetical protein
MLLFTTTTWAQNRDLCAGRTKGGEHGNFLSPTLAETHEFRYAAFMRAFLLAGVLCLAWMTSGIGAVDFSGTWVLDLKASDSPDPMTRRLGVSGLQRGLMNSAKLVSTYTQTQDELTIVSRAPGFSRTEQFRLDGQPESKTEAQTGPYTIRTSWSEDGMQLVSTSTFKTKDGKNATLRVTRRLTNGGQTLVLTQTLQVEGESPPVVIHRLWRKKSGAG